MLVHLFRMQPGLSVVHDLPGVKGLKEIKEFK